MIEKWQTISLGDFLELKRGYDLPKNRRKDGMVPIVSSSGISDYHNEAKVTAPGVVTGRYGTIGQVFYIAEDYWPLNTALYVRDFKGNNPLFAYYLLHTLNYNQYLDKAAVPGINRNDLHRGEVTVPVDVDMQAAIAKILSDLDEKIAINQQINQTLEAMAQACFKSWFVDFEPTRAKMILASANHPPPEGGSKDGTSFGEGASPATPHDRMKRYYTPNALKQAQALRKQQTNAEGLLWYYLKNKQLGGLKFRRQHPMGPYIVDFVCLSAKVIIELDGSGHAQHTQQKKDDMRSAYLEKQGFRVLRFWNNEVFESCFDVLHAIYTACVGADDTPPRKAGRLSTLPQGEGDAAQVAWARDYLSRLDPQIVSLFPSRLVDSELGEIPDGWEIVPLSSMIELIGGGTPKTSIAEYWNGSIPWFSVVDAPNESAVFTIDTEKKVTELGVQKSSTKILPVNTTIISARGTVGRLALAGVPMAMNQSCYGIRGDNLPDYYTYYCVRLAVSELKSRAHGSVFDTITRSTFETLQFVRPKREIAIAFDLAIAPSMQAIKQNLEQSQTLTQLRDSLLPKLLSGEISVDAAASQATEAV